MVKDKQQSIVGVFFVVVGYVVPIGFIVKTRYAVETRLIASLQHRHPPTSDGGFAGVFGWVDWRILRLRILLRHTAA